MHACRNGPRPNAWRKHHLIRKIFFPDPRKFFKFFCRRESPILQDFQAENPVLG